MPDGTSTVSAPVSRRAYGWLRARPTLAAAIVYAVLSLALFAPGLVPGHTLSASDMLWTASPWDSEMPSGVRVFGSNREMADSVQVFQPFLETTRERLPDIPLWNPSIMAGRPYLADAQSAIFSPFNVPGYVLPLWRSLAVIAALKIFLAAFGTFLLARALGMRFGGALLAGVVFGFSMWMVTWQSWPTTSVWAFLPWICLLTDILIRRPGPLPFAGLALTVAFQYFGGHPESCFHTLLFVALFWVIRMAVLRPGGARVVAGRALTFAGAIAAGTALAAVAILPFLELLNRSVDTDIRHFFGPSHMDRKYLLGVFLHDYWGRQTRTPLTFPSAMEESAYYVGALTLMLGVAALILRPKAQRIAIAALALGGLAMATGIPPVYDVLTKLPGFNTAHNARLALFFVFGMALLAGWGLDDISSGEVLARRRRQLVLGALGLLVVLPLGVMLAKGTLALGQLGSALKISWLFERPPSLVPPALGGKPVTSLANLDVPPPPGQVIDRVRLSSLLEWLPFALAGLALVFLRLRGRLGAAPFATAAVILLVLDLFKAGMGYNPAIPIDHAEQPATGAIRFLQDKGPVHMVALDAKHKEARLPPLPPDVAMRYGLYDARGYDYPIERRYDRFWHTNVAGRPECLYAFCPQTAGQTPKALRSLGLLGVQYLLQDRRDVPLRGAELVYPGPDARVYRNPYAVPHAYLVGAQAVAPNDDQAFAAVSSPRFDPRAVAVTDAAAEGVPQGGAGAGRAGDARIETYDGDRVVVRTNATRSALLVLTDAWAPGWKATVDGRDTPVRRADFLLRGVPVPAGAHRVEFSYEPASWRAGWIISLVTLLGLLAAIAAGRWWWPRRRGAGT
jgi:hypothetical protein